MINTIIIYLYIIIGSSLVFPILIENRIESYEPELTAKSAILIDYETGTILYEKNIDEKRCPASLTKLMTMHLTLKRIKNGSISYEDKVTISKEASSENMPVGSSLMYLKEGQHVSIMTLLRGLAVASGNDSAIAIAQFLSGDINNFVNEMNSEATGLGYKSMHFEDPSGLSDKNFITAREFGDFCRYYIYLYPDSLKEIHSVKSIISPEDEDPRKNYISRVNGINHYNHNLSLWTFFGVDGLKTGYIHASGYNLAITAYQEGMRLVAVILGVPGNTQNQGRANLEKEATELLSYGFENFSVIPPIEPQEIKE